MERLSKSIVLTVSVVFLVCVSTALDWVSPPKNGDQERVVNDKLTTPARGEKMFKAAVYEHRLIQPPYHDTVATRQQAIQAMENNLIIYENISQTAGKQGVNILVFPEDGIYGINYSRETIRPFLEYIPDPTRVTWNPCDEPGLYPDTDVQHRLSCMAKDNSLYLVANMGDNQPCDGATDPKCPDDGRYQFNTNVIFNPSGVLVARYHKQNLFFENQFNKPNKVELVTFVTPFGKFATFTCFDILFHDPAVTVLEDVDSVVFPTAWIDVLPFFAAIQFHSGFAAGMNVNLLAANLHIPEKRFGGSGIYTPLGAAVFYRNDSLDSGKLLMKDIPAFPANRNSSQLEVIHSLLDLQLNTREDIQFHADAFHDAFTFVALQSRSKSSSVCQGKLCCHLKFDMETNSTTETHEGDFFAFGAFDGLHTTEGQYYLQICTVLKCANSTPISCGSPTKISTTRFNQLELTGNFSTRYLFPEILVSKNGDVGLSLEQSNEWKFNVDILSSSRGFDDPLLSATLFGRIYDRD